MKLSPKTRRWVLLAALPLVAVAALHSNDGDEEASPRRGTVAPGAPGAVANANRAGEAAAPSIDPRRLQNLPRRHVSEQPPVDPFAVEAPRPPPGPPAAAAAPPPPPPPQAPPLPFRFIGRQDANGVVLVFLEQQNETHIVKLGETVGDGWRLDALDEHALTFTYVPLGQQRRLDIGSAG